MFAIVLAALSTATYANKALPNKNGKKKKAVITKLNAKKKALPSRECCTRSGTNALGEDISITLCAGWFLSNSINAYQRACDKANNALDDLIDAQNNGN